MIRKRNRSFKIKNNPRYINHHKSPKREVQSRVGQSYWSHVEEILEPRDAENNPPTSKRFWSFIKHARSNKSGISSLVSGCDVVTDSTTKAKLLNDQFQRAFSKSVPMKLIHIAEQATNGQASGSCYPSMPRINMTVAGVEKLLNELNPYKAPGPDNLQPRILWELAARLLQSFAIYSRFPLEQVLFLMTGSELM